MFKTDRVVHTTNRENVNKWKSTGGVYNRQSKQLYSTAMGSPVSVVVAEIVLCKTSRNKP